MEYIVIVGYFLLSLAVFIGIFLMLRTFFIWYWKIDTIISNQDTTNSLLRKLLSDRESSNNGYKNLSAKSELEILRQEFNLLEIFELEGIIKNFRNENKYRVLVALGTLRNKGIQYKEISEIKKHFNLDPNMYFWQVVSNVMNSN